jgi:hypothetical protein
MMERQYRIHLMRGNKHHLKAKIYKTRLMRVFFMKLFLRIVKTTIFISGGFLP